MCTYAWDGTSTTAVDPIGGVYTWLQLAMEQMTYVHMNIHSLLCFRHAQASRRAHARVFSPVEHVHGR